MKLDRVIAVRNTKTVYRDGDRCVKVFNAEYSKADVLHEAFNQAWVETIGLRVPKILEVTMLDGKWAIVSEYIKGKTLARLMEENPEKKRDYVSLFAGLQMEVHRLDGPLLRKQKDEIRRIIEAAGLDATLCRALCDRVDRLPGHSSVCHGDFEPSNVIVTDNGIPYILDWPRATQGDTSADAACTYLLLLQNGEVCAAELYLDTFCKKSRIDRQCVLKWLPIVAASRLTDGNERERAFLMGLIGTAP